MDGVIGPTAARVESFDAHGYLAEVRSHIDSGAIRLAARWAEADRPFGEELAALATAYFDDLNEGVTPSAAHGADVTRQALAQLVVDVSSVRPQNRAPSTPAQVVQTIRESVGETARQFAKAIGKGVRLELIDAPADLASLARAITDERIATIEALNEVAQLSPREISDTNTVRLTYSKACSLHDSTFSVLPLKAFKIAVHSHPSEPGAFLERSLKVVAELREDADFELVTEVELRNYVLGHPKDPTSAIAALTTEIEAISAEAEFASLGLAVIKAAAVRNADPREYLRNVNTAITDLATDPRIAALGKGTIKHVAAKGIDTAKQRLTDAADAVERLSANPKYAAMWKNARIRAAVSCPADPEGFLDTFAERYKSAREDPRLAIFGDKEVREVSLFNDNPIEALVRARVSLVKLVQNDRYFALGDAILTRSVVQHPARTEKWLDHIADVVDTIASDPRSEGYKRSSIVHAVVRGATTVDGLPARVSDLRFPVRTTYQLREILAADIAAQQSASADQSDASTSR